VPPVAERARRLSPEKFRIAKAEFDLMIQEGICQPFSNQVYMGITLPHGTQKE